ncbi:MAG: peptidylprolyl isomerase [Gammaproteobacteria bacterium]
MNYRNLVLLLASVLVIGGCDKLQTALTGNNAEDTMAISTMAESAPQPAGKVLATVNGKPITEDVFDIYIKTRKPQNSGEEANSQEAVLDELIALELMRQEGENNGVASRPMVVALMDQQRRSALASAAVNDFVQSNQTSDEDAQKVYDKQIGNAGKEYNARHILLATREEAVDVIAALEGGADFSELAMEKSTGPSGKNGGTLGWFAAGQMVKPFSDATAALEAGSYTSEPVETQFGWHVIILDESRDITPPPFDDVKERLKLLIVNQKLQQHINEIKASADIKMSGK